MKKKVCLNCGGPVGLNPARLAKTKTPVCSPECRAAVLKKERMAKVKYTRCNHCGKKLDHMTASGTWNFAKRFCNGACAAQWAANDDSTVARVAATKATNKAKARIDGGGLWFEIKNVMPHTPWNMIQFDGCNPLDPAVTLCGPWAARNGVECGA